MVDRTNGQSASLTLAQAEAQAQDIESQIEARELELASEEARTRGAFVPGTIEKQFELGSAEALRRARLELSTQQRDVFSQISQERLKTTETKTALQTQREKIAQAKSEQARINALRKAQEDRIRIAKVERKVSLRKFAERPRESQSFISSESFIPPTSEFQSLASPSDLGQVPTLLSSESFISSEAVAPSQVQAPIFQSLAQPSDLGITPSISSPASGLFSIKSLQEQSLPPRRGGVVPTFEGDGTAESFASGAERGAIIAQFTAPTREALVSPFFGQSQEFRETSRAVQLESQRTAEFVIGSDRLFSLSEAGFQTGLGDIRRGAITQARDEFSQLPASQKGLAFLSGVSQFPTRFIAGGAELSLKSIGQLSQQDPRQKRKVELTEESFLGRSLATPFLRPSDDLLGKVGVQAFSAGIVVVPALKSTGSRFLARSSDVGFRQAGAEAFSTFSPLSLKTTTLTPRTDFESFSVTFPRGDRATRLSLTSGIQDTRVTSFRVEKLRATGKGRGGVTGLFTETTEAPFIRIGGGGGFVTEGVSVRTIRGKIDAGSLSFGQGSLIAETETGGLLGTQLKGEFGISAVRTLSQPLKGFDIIGRRTTPIFTPQSDVFKQAEGIGLFRRTGIVTRISSKGLSGTDIRINVPSRDTGVESLGRGGLGLKQKPLKFDFPTTFTQPKVPRPQPSPRVTGRTSLDIIGIEASRIGDLPLIVGGGGRGTRTGFDFRGRGGLGFQEPSGQLELSIARPFPTVKARTDLGLGTDIRFDTGLVSGLAISQLPLSRARTGLGSAQVSLASQVSISRQFQPSAQATAQAQASKTAQRLATRQAQIFGQSPFQDGFGRGGRGRFPVTGFGFPLPTPTLGGFGVPARRRKGTRKPRRVAPSFTAGVLNLEAFEAIPVDPRFGISPFEIRRRLIRRPKKKKTSNKKKVTKKKIKAKKR